MNKFFAVSVGVLMTAMVGGLYAEPPHPKGAEYPNVHSLMKFKEALKLSDTQVQAIENLNKSFKEKYQVNNEKIKPLEARVRELEQAGSVDYAAMEPLLKEISETRAMVRLDKIKHQNELLGLLTPEQKSALKAKREAMRKEMKERMEKRKEKQEEGSDGPQ